MKKTFALFLLLLGATFGLKAQNAYNIYEGAAPGMEKADYPEMVLDSRVYNVTVPTVTVYSPDPAVNTGAAVIIAPGGGNMYLTLEEEGVNVAQWFQRHGITGIILKYRTNFMGQTEEEVRKSQDAFFKQMFSSFADMGQQVEAGKAPGLQQQDELPAGIPPMTMEPTIQGDDGRQAVRFVREHAADWGIDPKKIGLIGFSAGGALTCNVMFFNDDATRPDFAGPIYGYRGDRLPDNPVPTFFCGPEFDLFGPQDAFRLYEKFQAARIPCEIHFIYDATHGQGLLYNGKEWNEWIDLLYNFMKALKMVG